MILLAFLLGLTGSLAHCVGMCSGVALLVSRGRHTAGWHAALPHLGRTTTYALLGAVAGAAGVGVSHGTGHAAHALPSLRGIQVLLALLAAGAAVYLAAALVGWAPSPDRLLGRAVRLWGKAMRRAALRSPEPVEGRSSVVGRRSWFDQLTMSGRPSPAHPELVEGRSSVVGKPVLSLSKDRSSPLRHSSLRQAQDRLFALRLYATGLLWGLLPCGLVLTALLAAATTGSPLSGALTMFAFGAGTWPALLAIHLIHLLGRSGRPSLRYWKPQSATPLIPTSTGEQYRGAPSSPFPLGRGLGGRSPAALSRWAAASITLLFGVQMAFRGLAAGGWLAHLHIGRVMLW